MTQNTPKYEELCRRFLADTKDFAEEILDELDIKKKYNNESLEKCYKEIKAR